MNHFGIPLKPPRWSSLIQSVPWSGAHLVELVFDWAELHQNELRDNWRRAEEHMILQDTAPRSDRCPETGSVNRPAFVHSGLLIPQTRVWGHDAGSSSHEPHHQSLSAPRLPSPEPARTTAMLTAPQLLDIVGRGRKRDPARRESIGSNRMLWVSDYPHIDAHKDPVKELKEKIAALAPQDQEWILGKAAAELYRL